MNLIHSGPVWTHGSDPELVQLQNEAVGSLCNITTSLNWIHVSGIHMGSVWNGSKLEHSKMDPLPYARSQKNAGPDFVFVC